MNGHRLNVKEEEKGDCAFELRLLGFHVEGDVSEEVVSLGKDEVLEAMV